MTNVYQIALWIIIVVAIGLFIYNVHHLILICGRTRKKLTSQQGSGGSIEDGGLIARAAVSRLMALMPEERQVVKKIDVVRVADGYVCAVMSAEHERIVVRVNIVRLSKWRRKVSAVCHRNNRTHYYINDSDWQLSLRDEKLDVS